MLTSPLTLPQDASSIDLERINQDNFGSVHRFSDADAEVRMTIRHSNVKATATEPKKDRHNVEVVRRVFATADRDEYTRKVYFVDEHPAFDTDTDDVDGLADWLITAGTLAKLRNWES
jgi:predicted AAA+ superfamily ATPase